MVARVLCSFMFSSLSTRACIFFSVELQPCQLFCILYRCQGLFCPKYRTLHLLLNFMRCLPVNSSVSGCWSCPQVYQSFPLRFGVILKTDKGTFCLHLLSLIRKNITRISQSQYRPLRNFAFNQLPVSLTTELQLLSSVIQPVFHPSTGLPIWIVMTQL